MRGRPRLSRALSDATQVFISPGLRVTKHWLGARSSKPVSDTFVPAMTIAQLWRRRVGTRHRVRGRSGYRGRPARERCASSDSLIALCLTIWYSHAALGAKVIAAAGSQEKLDISIRYGGADHGVNYTKEGWQKEVLKLTGGKGVDVIYDPVGLIRGTSVEHCMLCAALMRRALDSLKCIAWKGRAIVVGFAAGQIEKVARFLRYPSAVVDISRIARTEPRPAQEHLHRRYPLGRVYE